MSAPLRLARSPSPRSCTVHPRPCRPRSSTHGSRTIPGTCISTLEGTPAAEKESLTRTTRFCKAHDTRQPPPEDPGCAARRLRPEDVPPHLAHRVSGLGRARRRRALLVGVRPRGVVPRTRPVPVLGDRAGARDRLHGLHYLLR